MIWRKITSHNYLWAIFIDSWFFFQRPKEFFEEAEDQESRTHNDLDKDMLPPSSDEYEDEEDDGVDKKS